MTSSKPPALVLICIDGLVFDAADSDCAFFGSVLGSAGLPAPTVERCERLAAGTHAAQLAQLSPDVGQETSQRLQAEMRARPYPSHSVRLHRETLGVVLRLADDYLVVPLTARSYPGITYFNEVVRTEIGDDVPWQGVAFLGGDLRPPASSVVDLLTVHEVGPGECVVVGDRLLPIDDLRAAGFRVVVVADDAEAGADGAVAAHEIPAVLSGLTG